MNLILQKIQGVYTKLPVKKVYVPEWDVTLYYKQVKGDELDLMAAYTPNGCVPTRSNAQVLIVKSLNEKGERVFDNEDGQALYEASDPDIINRVSALMMRTFSVSDMKDFSKPTLTS
jgi:hypothetical protein